jgi:hypothetical protein
VIGNSAVFVAVDGSRIGGTIVAADEQSISFSIRGVTLRAIKRADHFEFDEAAKNATEWDLSGSWFLWISEPPRA